jgi:SAM-dependent methyltransferase
MGAGKGIAVVCDVLDLRPAAVFEAGHPAGAVNIPLNELPDRTHELPPPGEPLTVLCGAHDRPAAEALLALRRPLRWIDGAHLDAGPLETGPSRGRLWRPAALLAEWIDRLPPGRALDLGCGSGRDAVFLAEHGFEVTAVDRLPDALARAEALAARRGVSIRTARVDLRGGSLPAAGPFEAVCCFYFLPAWRWPAVAGALSPGGTLLIEAFTEEHAARFGRPGAAHRVVRAGQLAAAFSGLDVLLDRRLWLGDRRHVCQLVARRP